MTSGWSEEHLSKENPLRPEQKLLFIPLALKSWTILADVLEEHRLAQEALERKMTQDHDDLKIAYQLASQEADEAKSENPLLCQVNALKMIEKAKTEVLKFSKKS